MIRYRRKSFSVDAMFFDGSLESVHQIRKWSKGDLEVDYVGFQYTLSEGMNELIQLVINDTHKNAVFVINPGEWVLRGDKPGQFLPYDDETFKEEFEEITD
jgi:hypothetical protein